MYPFDMTVYIFYESGDWIVVTYRFYLNVVFLFDWCRVNMPISDSFFNGSWM